MDFDCVFKRAPIYDDERESPGIYSWDESETNRRRRSDKSLFPIHFLRPSLVTPLSTKEPKLLAKPGTLVPGGVTMMSGMIAKEGHS